MPNDHGTADTVKPIRVIVCPGFDPCPKCKHWPPPGTTVESYRQHVENCGQPSKRPAGIQLRGPDDGDLTSPTPGTRKTRS